MIYWRNFGKLEILPSDKGFYLKKNRLVSSTSRSAIIEAAKWRVVVTLPKKENAPHLFESGNLAVRRHLNNKLCTQIWGERCCSSKSVAGLLFDGPPCLVFVGPVMTGLRLSCPSNNNPTADLTGNVNFVWWHTVNPTFKCVACCASIGNNVEGKGAILGVSTHSARVFQRRSRGTYSSIWNILQGDLLYSNAHRLKRI